MKIEFKNAKLFSKGHDLFDIVVNEGIISSIYPANQNSNTRSAIDLQGSWIAPAFVDAHVHVTNTGVALKGLDVSGLQSYSEAQRFIGDLPKTNDILLGHGWDDSKWEKTADSDLFPEGAGPIYLSRIDAHSALVSQSLLNLVPAARNVAGWDERLPLTQDAHGIVRDFAYQNLTDAQRKSYIDSALKGFASNGISAIEEMAGPKISSFTDAEIVSESTKDFGIGLKLWWGEIFGFENARKLAAYGCGGDLFIDGSLGSKTALISSKYSDETNGRQYISEEDCVEHILKCYEFQMPTSFHVIGDASIEIALKSFEKAKSIIGGSFNHLPHRLEHVEMLDDNQLKRAVNLGLIFSMQPQFDSYWAGVDNMYHNRIGERWKEMNPFRSILKSGGELVFSSDAPVTNINPWETIRAALNMANPLNSISYRAAFKAHTNSRNSNKDIAPGNKAEFAIWQVNDWQDLNDLPECLATFSSGRAIFSNLDGLDV